MKITEKTLSDHLVMIRNVVESHRKVSDRKIALTKLGYQVEELPMGSGGVLQMKEMKDGTKRVQIGYAHGRHNYAQVVILKIS